MTKIVLSSEQELILFLFRLVQRGKERTTCSLSDVRTLFVNRRVVTSLHS